MPAETTRAARWALPALVAGAAGIAFAPIFVRLSEVGPLSTAFWRMALATPVLAAIAARADVRCAAADGRRPGDARRLVVAGLCFAGDLTLWHLAIHRTSVANATLLPNLSPIFVTLGGVWFLRQRVPRAFVLALVVALAGVWTLVGASADLGGRRVEGDLLGVGTAVFYAGYILGVAALRGRLPTPSVLWAASAAASVPLLLLALLAGETLVPTSARGWAVVIGLALLSQVAGQGLIAFALAHLSAAFSSLTLLLQPVLAALLAWALLAEPLGGRQAAGGAIVLLGVLLARRATLAATGDATRRPAPDASSTAAPDRPRPPARPPSRP